MRSGDETETETEETLTLTQDNCRGLMTPENCRGLLAIKKADRKVSEGTMAKKSILKVLYYRTFSIV